MANYSCGYKKEKIEKGKKETIITLSHLYNMCVCLLIRGRGYSRHPPSILLELDEAILKTGHARLHHDKSYQST